MGINSPFSLLRTATVTAVTGLIIERNNKGKHNQICIHEHRTKQDNENYLQLPSLLISTYLHEILCVLPGTEASSLPDAFACAISYDVTVASFEVSWHFIRKLQSAAPHKLFVHSVC